MKKVILLLIAHYSLLIASCFSQPSITWQRVYDGPLHVEDEAYDVCPADNGNFYIAGITERFPWVVYVLKINPYGDTIWTRTFQGCRNCYGQVAYAVAPSIDNGCVFTGFWNTDSAYAMKLNKYGNIVWQQFYEAYTAQLYSINRTLDQGFICCGRISYLNGYIIKIDSVGNLQWQKIYYSNSNNTLEYFKVFESIEEAFDGGYIAVGFYDNPSPHGIITRLNDTGDVLWEKTITIGDYEPVAYKIVRLNGTYLIGGTTFNTMNSLDNIYFARIDLQGNIFFRKIFYENQNEYFHDIKVINSNRYVISLDRDSISLPVLNGKALITDSVGNILHDRTFRSAYSYSMLRAVIPIENGDLLFVGLSDPNDSLDRTDVYAVRTDSTLYAPPIGINPISNKVPSSFNLYQNYPNPFNSTTVIKFDIISRNAQTIILKIFDITGRMVDNLVNKTLTSGSYSINWNANKYSSGVYFVALYIDDVFYSSIKMVLLR